MGYAVTRYSLRQEQALPGTAVETETVNELENQVAVNQDEVKPILETGPEKEFYLVAESGFLLVFSKDQSTICLYTHNSGHGFSWKRSGSG